MTRVPVYIENMYNTAYFVVVSTAVGLQSDFETFGIGVITGLLLAYGAREWKKMK